MSTTTIARRARTAMAVIAGTALLGLSACSTDAGDSPEEPSAAPPAASDGGGAATDGDQDDQDDGETGAAGERIRIMLVTDLGVDDTGGEGAPVLASDELAALLADPFGDTAECADELVLEPGAASVGCVGPTSMDDTAPTQEWVANVVVVPSEAGLRDGSRVAVLFSTGVELPEDADELLQQNVSLTGVGFGSAFGMQPLSAQELAESTLQTLTSENAYVPVAEKADWSDVTCEDGLDFAEFETVDCTATTAEGDSWQLHVAPGTFVDGDQGLLVGIASPRDV